MSFYYNGNALHTFTYINILVILTVWENSKCSENCEDWNAAKLLNWSRNVAAFLSLTNESPQDKANIMASAPSEDSDQPGHPPGLTRLVAVRMKKPWVLSYPLSVQGRLWSDWADAQADLSLLWAHMPFRWFCHDVAQIIWALSTSDNNSFWIFWQRCCFFFQGLGWYFQLPLSNTIIKCTLWRC